ncbi:MAG: hypothetical protein MUF43_03635, partial [Flavobacterium sp.]|nr:hypothetical protein [Flavobacterium sp.]MCU0470232.1 hypothetical protein [Arcicella sp.]
MATQYTGVVFVPGVGYIPTKDLNKVQTGTKATSSTTQVITTRGEKKVTTFDKIFDYLQKAVGIFGTVADGIQKIKSGSLPQVDTLDEVYQEKDWLGADADGVGKKVTDEPEKKNFSLELTG